MNAETNASSGARMPVAIIGASCIVGGAGSPDQLWEHLSRGAPPFAEVPPGRFPWRDYFSPDPADTDKGSVWRASFFEEMELPWRELKIGPKMLDGLHRSEVYIIEAIRRALVDAELLARPSARERTAVIMGASEMGYDFRILHPYIWHVPELLTAAGEALDAAGTPPSVRAGLLQAAERGMLECSRRDVTRGAVSGMSITLGRACSLFDLKGPHYVVNSDGASMLAALEQATRGLLLGDYDVALVGGISPYLSPAPFVAFDRLGMLTGEAHPRPFDAGATGTLLGEGVGFVALRRLDHAIAAGDRIHGVIRGIGGANEGRRAALVAAPRVAQVLAAERAYAQAGYGPEDVQYLECHATGVESLDGAELTAMAQVFQGRAQGRLTVASTKDMVGYLHAAAALPGLIRTLTALQRRTLPAQRHVRQPRAELGAADSPFQLLPEPTPWPTPRPGQPRRAAINSLAMAGQAYHMTLEEYVPDYHARAAREARPVRRSPVAVVAHGALTPGSTGSAEFFANLLAKTDQIVRVPSERFDIDRYFDANGGVATSYCSLGGFVRDLHFDGAAARIPPAVVAQLDRTHLYALTVAAEAMQTTTAAAQVRERTAVFMADMPGRQREREVELRIVYATMDGILRAVLRDSGMAAPIVERVSRQTEQRFKRDLSPLTPHTLPGYGASAQAALIAHTHSFRGPTAVFESTCASSMAAIGAGVAALQLGDIDMALTGGSFADLSPELYTVNCTFKGLSAMGSRPFDADASGFIPGEGAGVLVLKRLADAERDGDEILGIIAGVGASSDGKGKSLLAPNPVGQELAVRRALENAGVDPAAIQYIACHGTATPVGDYTEVSTYAQVMRGLAPHSVAMASVKSMIGHLHSAAGVVNVVAVLKGLQRRVQPPQINCDRPNPDIAWADIPLVVLTEQRPWPAPAGGAPRRAGVSAFGMGGTNYHLIVEEYQDRRGRPALPGPARHPMIDTVLERAPQQLVAIRDLSIETDLYLPQHQLAGVPVLPGTFAMEMMAEAAVLLRPELRVVGMQALRFHQAAKVWPGRSTRLVVTARMGPPDGVDSARVIVQVETEVQPNPAHSPVRRKVATATVRLAGVSGPPPTVNRDVAGLFTAEARRDIRAIYNRTDDIYCGPMMQGLRHLRFVAGTQMGAWITQADESALFSFTSDPLLQIGPLALDSIHHAAGVVAYYQHERVTLPASADRVRFHRRLPSGRDICVLSQYHGRPGDAFAALDVVAFDPETQESYVEIDGLAFSLGEHMGPFLKPLIEGRSSR